MKEFIPIKNNTFTFSNCDDCNARCCDGQAGTIFAQIIINDFEKVYNHFPILFIFGDLAYLKPVILLTNGNFCKYLKDLKCTIYDKRPSICKTYPLSSNIDEQAYIDIYCPAVNDNKLQNPLVKNKKVSKEFDNELLYDYQKKYINTFYEFESFNNKENFKLAIKIKGMNFFKYTKQSSNKYMSMHLESLKHLEDTYFKNSN